MKNFLLLIFVLFITALINNTSAQNWVLQTNPLGFGEEAMLGKVHFVSDTEGWISCGNGGFLHTTDGGTNWIFVNPFPSDTVECMSDPSVSMSWVGTTHGWNISSIGSLDSSRGAVIYKTTNSGANWSKVILSNEEGNSGIQLQFTDINNGWALLFNFNGGIVTFLRTTDGGNTWNPTTGTGLFYFVDSNNGWAHHGSGEIGFDPPYKIYRTTDGGNNWTEQFSDNSEGQYSAISFSDLNNGWVVGAKGKVLRTTNGGTNWTFVTNSGVNDSTTCRAVFPLDASNVWISSRHNDFQNTPYLVYTSDGGSNWTSQTTPFGDPNAYNPVFSIYFTNPQNGWITGDYGRIAKYTGTTSIEDDVNNLTDYSLGQNYPNPFNPSTNIKFKIPEGGYTTIKVYNILGSEVATLLNEMKQPGIYEVSFDAAGLSSGTYFYAMESGTFREVRKMIILR
ncbi:MAG: T9SS type A sorting domain-containing protein [Ignavibacterium sp.]|nr:T9SS type A sorting domain-containing protein [Ignavibacterium sp.]